jgi:hypothetical protein
MTPVVDYTGIHSYAESQQKCLDIIATHGERKHLKGFAFQYFSIEFLTFVFTKMSTFLEHLGPEAARSAIILENYPVAKIRSVAHGDTAFANRGNALNCVLAMRWTSPAHDGFVRGWIAEFVEGAKAVDETIATQRGEKAIVKGGYANFEVDQGKAVEAFRENLPRLKEVKKKWDPKARFNKWCPIPVA